MKQRKFINKMGKVSLMGLFVGIGLVVTTPTTNASQSVELSWTPSVSPDIVGYNIYYGAASGDYTNEISVGNTTNVTVSGLLNSTTYYFAARAINSQGIESAYSVQTSYIVPSAAALIGNLVVLSNTVSITVKGLPGSLYVIQASTDLVNWISLETNITPLMFTDTNTRRYNRRFYRALYLF
ncbi:MAG TPA: fibronectin type III domain-containing protein [Candidatus Acidoferrales bacterium]|nr:fibronectin type III domain-containing protein [Candidatus Acidoferrales bacterium]